MALSNKKTTKYIKKSSVDFSTFLEEEIQRSMCSSDVCDICCGGEKPQKTITCFLNSRVPIVTTEHGGYSEMECESD